MAEPQRPEADALLHEQDSGPAAAAAPQPVADVTGVAAAAMPSPAEPAQANDDDAAVAASAIHAGAEPIPAAAADESKAAEAAPESSASSPAAPAPSSSSLVVSAASASPASLPASASNDSHADPSPVQPAQLASLSVQPVDDGGASQVEAACVLHVAAEDEVEEEEKSPSVAPNAGAAASASPVAPLSIDSGDVSPVSSPAAAAATAVASSPLVLPPLSPPAQHVINIDNTHDGHIHEHRMTAVMPTAGTAATARLGGTGRDYGSTNTTWRETNSTRPSPLKKLPQEVMELMLSFCDAETLVRFGRTSSLHNSLSCRKNLWTSLLSRPWPGYNHAGQPINGVRVESSAKQYYAERRRFALKRREERLEDYEGQVFDVRLNHRAWWCYLCTDFLHVPCVSIFGIIFLICLVYQLQKHQAVSFLSLWPLVAIVGFTAIVTTVLCCAKWIEPVRAPGRDRRMIHPVLRLPQRFYEESGGIVHDMMEAIGQGDSLLAHVSSCIMMAVLGLFVVLLVLRITDHITWSWWCVFAPLYAVFASFCCAPCLRWPDTSRVRFKPCIAVWCFLGAPLLAFVLLLNFKLQYDSLLLVYALIPLFVLDLLMFLMGIWYCVEESSIAGMLIWLAVDGPLLVFKILLALYVDQHLSGLSPALMFIPLYLTQLFLICGCLALTSAVADDSEASYDDWPNEPDLRMPPV